MQKMLGKWLSKTQRKISSNIRSLIRRKNEFSLFHDVWRGHWALKQMLEKSLK